MILAYFNVKYFLFAYISETYQSFKLHSIWIILIYKDPNINYKSYFHEV